MGRGPNDDPILGERMWFRSEFIAQARARELGVSSGTVTGWSKTESTVTLESDDGQVFTVRRDRVQFTAPAGLSQKREAAAKPAKPRVRKEAVDPALGEEMTLFETAGGHRDPG